MKSTRRPLVLAVAGAALALASLAALVADGQDGASGSGRFPVLAHDGMAPGTVPALVMLLGLVIVGVGAAVHDGRERTASIALARTRQPVRQPVRQPARPSTRPAVRTAPVQPPTLRVVARPVPRPEPRPVHVITSLPPRAPATSRHHTRRTASGTRIELVGTGRRG